MGSIEMSALMTSGVKRRRQLTALNLPANAKWIGLLIVFLILSTSTMALASKPKATNDFSAFVDELERAVVRGDAEKLVHYRQELESDSKNWGVDAALRQYTLAYVSWRISDLLEDKEGDRILKQAEGILAALIRKNPDNAEALALLGSVYGSQISSAWKGMRLGPKAGEALDRAEKVSPNNPRVVLQQAISAFYTPKMFGGGLELAEEKLRRAEELFEKEPALKPWPDWGRVDVYVWLGQVLAKTGDYKGAGTAYEKGLSLEPHHAWILNELLPALEKSKLRDAR